MNTVQRPTGVTILALLGLLTGTIGLLDSFNSLAKSMVMDASLLAVSLIIVVRLLLYLVFSYGAWKLKPWAWTLGVFLEVVTLVITLYRTFTGADLRSLLPNTILALVILWYLSQSEIREVFSKA